MKKITLSITALLAFFYFNACTNSDIELQEDAQAVEKIITGIAQSIEYGKDGYTAQMKTRSNEVYYALISITNLGRENYTVMEIGDQVTLEGIVQSVGDQEHLKVSNIINIEKATPSLLISETSFDGITSGDEISKYTTSLEKEILKTGEGDFDIYRIKSSEGSYAYLMPDPRNEALVGNIIIDSPKAKTKDGFHVGSTLGDLTKKYPDLKIHGSEIEGRTHATIGNLAYRLDSNNWAYEIDKSKIPLNTKILNITINR